MDRGHHLRLISQAFDVMPAVALLGPRQCGKTTLALHYAALIGKEMHHFDLEDPQDLQLFTNPKLLLENLEGLIIIDEVQKVPELFPLLRTLIDKNKDKQKFLILGSASRELIRQSLETLAGRVYHLELTPFSFRETQAFNQLWVRGGFPLSYLAESDKLSYLWRKEYISTFLERDIPALGIQVSPNNIRRFWMMLAHYHGGIFKASEIGNSLDSNHKSMRYYLDILSGTFMVRILYPWHENIGKRQVKSPKVYFRDSGILHSLLGIEGQADLVRHPKLGVSWEGFAVEEVIRAMEVDNESCYFWSTHSGAELDLLILKNGKRIGFEFKYSDAPKITKSMHIAMADLKLDELNIIYPGDKKYKVDEKIQTIGLPTFIMSNA